MKVALINKNPAVARLITLSLNKIGVEYIELDNADSLNENVDFIIVDSDVDASDEELKVYSDKIMHLIPRGLDHNGKLCLEKPFLPTEFISIFEQNKPAQKPIKPDMSNSIFVDNDNTDFDEGFDSFELPDISEFDTYPQSSELKDVDLENELDLAMNLNLDEPEDNTQKDTEQNNDLNISIGDDASISSDDEKFNDNNFSINELTLNENLKEDVQISDTNNMIDQDPQSGLDELSNNIDDINSTLDSIQEIDDDTKDENLQISDEYEIAQDSKNKNEISKENDISFEAQNFDDISQDDEILNIKNALSEIDEETIQNDNIKQTDNTINAIDLNDTQELTNDDEINPDLKTQNFDLDIDSTFDKTLSKTDEEEDFGELSFDDLGKEDDMMYEFNEDTKQESKADEQAKDQDNKNELMQDQKLDPITTSQQMLNETILPPGFASKLYNLSNNLGNKNQKDVSNDNANDDFEKPDWVLARENKNFKNIDDISQNDMINALGLTKNIDDTQNENKIEVLDTNKNSKINYNEQSKQVHELANEIQSTIANYVTSSINTSAIREVLKGMNIKINISFEDKQ